MLNTVSKTFAIVFVVCMLFFFRFHKSRSRVKSMKLINYKAVLSPSEFEVDI